MNKKAQSGHALQLAVRMFIALGVAIIIAGFVTYHSTIERDVYKPKADMLIETLLSPVHGITYLDPYTGQDEGAIIDKRKFDDLENFKIDYGLVIAAKVKLGNEIKYVNKQTYQRLFPEYALELNQAGLVDIGGSASITNIQSPILGEFPKGIYFYRESVKVFENNMLDNQKLEITVVVQR